MKVISQITAALAVASLTAVASPADAAPGAPPPPITIKIADPPGGFALNGNVKKGKKLYKTYCKKCHGKKGNGGGLMAKDLDPKPRDFTLAANRGRTDWQLFLGIRDGGKPLGLSEKMTPWKDTLTEEEIHHVIAYIRTFAK